MPQREIAKQAPKYRHEATTQIKKIGASAGKTSVEQDDKVANFLRNFVRDDGQTGNNAKLGVGEKRSGYKNAVGEIMQTVADQNHPPRFACLMCIMAVGMIMTISFVMMRMAQNGEFFEQKKPEQTSKQGSEQRMGIGFRFKRFGQGMQ